MKTFKQFIDEEGYDKMRDRGLKTGARRDDYNAPFPKGSKNKPATLDSKRKELTTKYGKPTEKQHGPHTYHVWKTEKGNVKIKK